LKQKTSFQTCKLIYNEGGFGLNGLNRGLTSTLGRHGIWNMVYFGIYHNIKVFIPKTDVLTFLFKKYFFINQIKIHYIFKEQGNRVFLQELNWVFWSVSLS
jgi:hypothetical protein